MDHEERTDLSYSRVLTVRAVSTEGTPDLLKLARQRAPDESVFDELAPVFFSGEISSSRWDAYDTRMLPSTLKNFAAEAGQGVAVLLDHNPRQEPVGQSLTGRFIGGSGDGVARVESDFFVLPLPDVAASVSRMRGGVRRDQSVGFYGGVWRCTICQKDMSQWLSRDGCPHFLGMMYQPRDEAGQPAGEPQKARAEIDGAHLAEYSSVYDGATPGAMLQKARAMAADGALRGEERELVAVRYRTMLPEAPRAVRVGFDPTRGRETPEGGGKESGMEPKIEDGGVRLSDGRLLTVVEVATLATQAEAARSALERLNLQGAPDLAARASQAAQEVEGLRGDLPRLRTLAAPLESLTPPTDEPNPDAWRVAEFGRLRGLADDGRRYREDLIEEALTEGVRAYGSDFAREQEQADLQGASLETIKRRLAQWKATGDQDLKGSRQTVDGPPAAAPTGRQLPAAAFS